MPARESVTVSRLSDQDREFLEFAERTISGRETSSGSRSATRPATACSCAAEGPALYDRRARRVEGAGPRREGRGAAAVLARSALRPESAPLPTASQKPRAVRDHRQLLPGRGSIQPGTGVVQNIFGAIAHGRRWASTFTQEWPAPSQTHQLSYTVAFVNGDADRGSATP